MRVHAASVNPLDAGSLKGRPYLVRLMTGLRRPKITRPGVDFSGQVEAVGANVMNFKPSDQVFGMCTGDLQASGPAAWMHAQGSFAEYVCVPESILVSKPDTVTFEQAASVPVAGLTALQGLRDKVRVQPGQKLLMNGAAGGVGTFAVQIAKSLGAVVSGICSSRNVEMVRSIGADHVIDYTQEDFTKGGLRYDVIFDCVGNHSLSDYARVLEPHGTCVMVGDLTGRGMLGMLARLLTALVLSRFGDHKLITFLAKPSQRDLEVLRDLMKSGQVKPVVDKSYGLAQIPDAIRYLEEKHARGKIVIRLV